jgi:ATP-binding cassette subfamily C protein
MGIVADPGIIQSNAWLHRAYTAGGFTSDHSFLLAVGLGAIVVLTLGNLISALTAWGQLRYAWSVHHSLSCRLFADYLSRPYPFFVGRNSSTLHQNILAEVGTAVLGVLLPVLNVIAQGLVIFALVGLLVAVDPQLALIAVGVLGGAYSLLYLAIRRRQAHLGHDRLEAHRERYKIAGEAFGGIKDVKILQCEDSFLQRFEPPSLRFAQANAGSSAVAQLPRYLLETVAFSGILLIVLYSLGRGEGIGQVLPVVSLYAFAGYRLLPALQALFSSVTGIRFQRASLAILCDDLERLEEGSTHSADSGTSGPAAPPVDFERSIEFEGSIGFEGVTFRYPEADKPILDRVRLSIAKNTTVGLVGVSGGGKTTLVDLLLGLYPPTDGVITVDGTVLDEFTLPSWRRQVGYVPQTIFLADDTIARNIAFGVEPAEIDRHALERASQMAHLTDLLAGLPQGMDTVIGERGVRLSGGQRQRIGIARALYRDPSVLVFDEATSALDERSEKAVLEAVSELAGRKTLVIIAHRLTASHRCDRVYVVDGGRIRPQGDTSS